MADRITFADVLECGFCVTGMKEHAKLVGYSWTKLIREGYPVSEAEEALKINEDEMLRIITEHAKAR
jgi:hypothetical protein